MSTEPSENDLLHAVKDSLDKDGRLGKFKAELRTAVMSILNKQPAGKEPPEIPCETNFINELMREYLIWNGYRYSEQILVSESGQKNDRMEREMLATRLGVVDTAHTKKIPLLYYLVATFQEPQDP